MPPTPTNPPPFAGFASPNYTQVPDELFDLLMPQLSECELRVLLYIVRRTFGFKRQSDAISLSQLVSGIITRGDERLDHGAGVARSSAVRAIKGLLAKGVIVVTKHASARRGNETTSYALRFNDSHPQEPVQQSDPRLHHETGGGSTTVKPALVSSRNSQETGEQQTDFDTSKGKHIVDKTEVDEGARYPQLRQPDPSRSGRGMQPVGALVGKRTRRPGGGADHQAIVATIAVVADELGDQASRKATVGRALHLFADAGISRDAFIDLLFQVKGEVQDRHRYPGKAPIPRNRMAYFFAVVEDRLGVRAASVGDRG